MYFVIKVQKSLESKVTLKGFQFLETSDIPSLSLDLPFLEILY